MNQNKTKKTGNISLMKRFLPYFKKYWVVLALEDRKSVV